MKSKEVAEILLKTSAVSINPEHPFKFASGILSPIYTDCRVLSSFPTERRLVIDQFIEYVSREVGEKNIDIIVGTAHSGISLAVYIAERYSLPMAYIRSSAKEHGKHRQVEGILKKGFRVLLVSDIISTEQDIPISVKAIKNAGAEIACCLTIFSNNLGVIESFLEEEKIKYHSLTDIKELLEVAGEKKLMSPTSQAVVFEWTRNPDNWNKQRQAKIGKILRKNKEKISSALLEIKAVTVDTKNPFCFASGILSPVYTDNRLLMAYPGKWKEVIDSFTSIIINKIGIQNVDVICGTSTAGIPHAAYLSEKLGLPLIYVKSKKEEYGKHTIIEGNMRRGDRVLIIEDLVSSGGSSISASSVIREAGGIVENCLAILTYGMKEATKCFEREKVELITLTDLNTLLKVAVTERYITLKEQDTILNWVDDPRSWEKNQDFDLSQTQKTPLE